jgi:hypothetical protein
MTTHIEYDTCIETLFDTSRKAPTHPLTPEERAIVDRYIVVESEKERAGNNNERK